MIITLGIFACENGCGTKDQIEVDFHIFLCERGGVKKLRGGGADMCVRTCGAAKQATGIMNNLDPGLGNPGLTVGIVYISCP